MKSQVLVVRSLLFQLQTRYVNLSSPPGSSSPLQTAAPRGPSESKLRRNGVAVAVFLGHFRAKKNVAIYSTEIRYLHVSKL